MGADEVVVKKVKPYPIPASFERDAIKFDGRILKLVMHAFLAEIGSKVIKVGEIYNMEFRLPASGEIGTSKVKVIKTYDKVQPGVAQSATPVRLAEFHFFQPSEDLKQKVKNYLIIIRQSGSDEG